MNVEFRASFSRDLKERQNQRTVEADTRDDRRDELAHSLQDISGLKKLKGASKLYRIKVGEYRIGLALKGDTVVFVRCLDRKDIYRYFP